MFVFCRFVLTFHRGVSEIFIDMGGAPYDDDVEGRFYFSPGSRSYPRVLIIIGVIRGPWGPMSWGGHRNAAIFSFVARIVGRSLVSIDTKGSALVDNAEVGVFGQDLLIRVLPSPV